MTPAIPAHRGEELLSIGELAVRSGLSPKALRMYDESGLLPPRRVDPVTGYRSYGTDQVGRARLIASLRGVGMGLARIRVLCDLDVEAAAWELRAWWRQEQADVHSRAAAVDDLARTLGEPSTEDPMITTDTTLPIDHGAAVDRGAVRPRQQDAALTRTLAGDAVLIAVADGFGADDHLAARMLDALAERLRESCTAEAPSDGPGMLAALGSAWTSIEALIPREHAAAPSDTGGALRAVPGDAGSSPVPPVSGAAVTAALIRGDALACAHIGDTRALLVRGGRIDPITQDHTQVRSLLAAGRLTAEEAASHRDRAILNRALCDGAPTAPDLLLRRLEPGDTVAVLSDGVHAVVDPATLAEDLLAGSGEDGGEDGTASELAAALVARAVAAGGPDNAAAAVARIGGSIPAG